MKRPRPLEYFRRQTRKEQLDIVIMILCLTGIGLYAIWWLVS